MSELDDINGLEEQKALKIRLIKRLLVAIALILLAVGGMQIFDRLTSHVATPVPQSKPLTPAVPATPQIIAPPRFAPAPQASAPVAVPALPPASAPIAAPAPALQGSAPAQASAPLVAPVPEAAPAPVVEPSPVEKTPAPVVEAPVGRMKKFGAREHEQRVAPSRQREPYLVQVGVFASIENAEKMAAKLRTHRLMPKMESRVQAGPFKQKSEADEAAKKLHAAGIDAVKAGPDDEYLQAGLFGSAQHARQMVEKLKLAGVPVKSETRVRLGPFDGKAQAETVRKKLKAAGIESMLVPGREGR